MSRNYYSNNNEGKIIRAMNIFSIIIILGLDFLFEYFLVKK